MGCSNPGQAFQNYESCSCFVEGMCIIAIVKHCGPLQCQSTHLAAASPVECCVAWICCITRLSDA